MRGARRRISATAVALVMVAGAIALIPGSPANATDRSIPRMDRNADGRGDFGLLRMTSATSYTTFWRNFSNFATDPPFGDPSLGDIPIAGDFDGDGINDPAVVRPGAAYQWVILLSTTGFTVAESTAFGSDNGGGAANDDVPLTGDIDGDGRTDFFVFRPGTPARWFVLSRAGGFGQVAFGDTGSVPNDDAPALGDLDGDGRSDLIIRRTAGNGSSFFHIRFATGAFSSVNFGNTADPYVAGDFDGDGIGDITVVQTLGNGDYLWVILRSLGGVVTFRFGNAGPGDVLVQNDYDGNGFTDIAVWRPGATGTLFIQPVPFGPVSAPPFGTVGDIPLLQCFNGYQNLQSIGVGPCT